MGDVRHQRFRPLAPSRSHMCQSKPRVPDLQSSKISHQSQIDQIEFVGHMTRTSTDNNT